MSARIEAFGQRAERYAAGLPDGLRAVVTTPELAAHALAAATARRESGETFYACVLLEDAATVLPLHYAPQLLSQRADLDEQRSALDALASGQVQMNGRALSTLAIYDDATIKTLRDFVLLSDGVLARSHADRLRLERVLGRRRPWSAVFASPDPRVPRVRAAGTNLVLWAPDMRPEWLTLAAFALSDIRQEVLAVCSIPANVTHGVMRCVGLDEAPAVLQNAGGVIDCSIDAPESAIALAALGVPLAVASSSGAIEWLDGVLTYDPVDWRSMLSAARKLGAERPPLKRAAEVSAAAAMDRLSIRVPASEALVSILVPTYNRRELLHACLSRLQQQTYVNYEIVVVNDGGIAVEDVVAKFPKARLINRAQNGGVAAALNTAWENARGEYLCICADDDRFFPDFLARSVRAAVESRAMVVHCNMILRFEEPAADGGLRTYGFHICSDGYLDRTEMLAYNPVQVLLFHRSVFQPRGYLYDEQFSVLADYEATLYAAQSHDFVHLDYVGMEGVYRLGEDQISRSKRGSILDELGRIYAAYPAAGRPVVAQRRDQNAQAMAATHVNGGGFQPSIRLP